MGITCSLQSLFMGLVRRPVWNRGSFFLPRTAQDNDGFTGPGVLAQNPQRPTEQTPCGLKNECA